MKKEKEIKPVEEINPTEEVSKEEKTEETVEEPEPVVEEITYSSEHLQKIETERDAFLKTFRKNNLLKSIVAGCCFALIIFACIVVPSAFKNLASGLQTGLTIGLTIMGLALMITFSTLTKKKMDKKMKAYFETFYNELTEFVFDQKGFENAKVQHPGKIDINQFTEADLYKDIVEVGSRGLTEFEFNKIPMAVVDCAGNIRDQKAKRLKPVFVGKYLFAASSYLDENQIVVYLKGNERSLPPTNLDGLNKVEENEKYDIYSNNEKWNKFLTRDILKKIDEFCMDKILVDLAIEVKSGKTYVMMGYDDPVMILPLQQQFDPKPQERYKEDLLKICELVEVLSK